MAQVTGVKAERVLAIEADLITNAEIQDDDLVLVQRDGGTIVVPDIAAPGGITKVTSFPTSPTDGDMIIHVGQAGDPIYKYSDGAWELQPRMGAQTVPSVRLTHSVTQTAANNANHIVAFDTEQADTDGMHDTVTNNSRITIKTPGVYRIEGYVQLAAPPAGRRVLSLRLNGATVVAENRLDGDAMDQTAGGLPVSITRQFAAGDYIELVVFQTSGGALNLNKDGEVSPQFGAIWLGGAGQTVDERGVPSALVYSTTDNFQSIPNLVETIVSFNGESHDTDGIHDNGTNNSRLTAKTPGLYRISGVIAFATATNATARVAALWKNGTKIYEVSLPAENAMSPYIPFATEIMLAAGDYIEVSAWQNSGGAVNLRGNGTQPQARTHVAISLVASGKTVTPHCRARRTTNQSIPNVIWTTVSFDSEISDNDLMHDIAVNTSRMTIRTAGVYAIGFHGFFAANGTGNRRTAALYLNGTKYIADSGQAGVSGAAAGTPRLDVFTIREFAVGDYIEAQVFHDSGGALDLVTSDETSSIFYAAKIGAPISGPGNVETLEGKHVIGGAGEPVFENGWVAGTGGEAPGFYKDRGRVYLRGSLNAAAATADTAFTLPVGYRPASTVSIPITSRNNTGTAQSIVHCNITNGGLVRLQTDAVAKPGVDRTNNYLDGVSFAL